MFHFEWQPVGVLTSYPSVPLENSEVFSVEASGWVNTVQHCSSLNCAPGGYAAPMVDRPPSGTECSSNNRSAGEGSFQEFRHYLTKILATGSCPHLSTQFL